jgi:hypothetical protein
MKVHYHIHEITPLGSYPELLQFSAAFISCFPKLHYHVTFPCISNSLKLSYQIKILCVFLIFHTHAACPFHVTVLNMITLTMTNEVHNLVRFSILLLLFLWPDVLILFFSVMERQCLQFCVL